MQTRPYPEKNGLRIWLTRSEQRALLEAIDDEPPRRIALQLGLHGLRTDEIVQVEPRHFRELANGADGHVLTVPDGKTGKREAPISDDLASKCPSSRSPHQVRTGSVTSFLDEGTPKAILSDRVDMTEDVMDEHYDQGTKREKMHRRQEYLRGGEN